MAGVNKQAEHSAHGRLEGAVTVTSSNLMFENFYGKMLWKKVIGMIRKAGIGEAVMEDVAFSSLSSSQQLRHLWVQTPAGLTWAIKGVPCKGP